MSNTTTKTLAEHLLAFEKLTDNEDVYVGDALRSGKGLEKARKGREKLANGDDETPLVVIDSTVWGSVAEGFYITENHIYAKALYEDKHVFGIKDVHTITVDEDEKAMLINGIAIKWLSDSITPKATIIARCIREYLDSRTPVTSAIQEGLGTYIAKLKKQLDDLHSDICNWNLIISRKTTDVVMDNTNHMPIGSENFIDRMSIAASRNKALNTYDQLRKEADAKIRNLNNAVPVKHANKQCCDFDLSRIEFAFDFGTGPDRNTAISNDDWQSRTDDALYKLQDCGGHLMSQLEKLISQLTHIQQEECDDND
jgi:hypothetical protein